MGKLQGYIKPIKSTTLRVWRKDREEIELAWDGYDILLYRNGKYLRRITETPTIQIEVWDPEKSYLAGDNFVSYKSPDYQYLSDDDPLKDEYIYRCDENTSAGESPATHPEKWLRQGKVGEQGVNTIFLSDVSGLEEALNKRVKYTDFSEEFSIDSDSKKVSLNIDYITLTNVSGKNLIQPGPNEIKISNSIWKIFNEDYQTSSYTRYRPGQSFSNVDKYGWLYNKDGVTELLNDTPGYRLPSISEIEDLNNHPTYSVSDFLKYEEGLWEHYNDYSWTPDTDLNLLPAGYYTNNGSEYINFSNVGYYWTQEAYDTIYTDAAGNGFVSEFLLARVYTNETYYGLNEYVIRFAEYDYKYIDAMSVRLVRDI